MKSVNCLLLLMILVMLFTCGCHHNNLLVDSFNNVKEESVTPNVNGMEAMNTDSLLSEVIVQGVYKETVYSLPENWTIPFGFFPESDPTTGNTAFLVTRYNIGNDCLEYGILTCDDNGEFGEISILYCPENGRIQQVIAYQNQWLYTVIVTDPDTMRTDSYLLSQNTEYPEDKNDIFEKRIDIFPKFLSADKEGDIYLADQYNIQVLTSDLNLRNTINIPPQEGWIKAMGRLPDGNIYICSNRNGWKISLVDKVNATIGNGTDISFNPVSVIFRDSGKYALYIQTESGVDAYSFDGAIRFETEIVNFMKSGIVIPISDLPVEYVPGTVLIGTAQDGQLWFRRSVDDVSNGYPVLFQPSDNELPDDVYVLKLAYINELEADFKTAIAAYAASHPEVTFIFEDYTPSGSNGGPNRLLLNLINGVDCPDLIIGNSSNPDFLAIREKKLYIDLMQYVKNDSDVNKNTVFGCIMDSYATEDRGIWALPKSFTFLAYLSTDDYLAEFADRGTWTISEMIKWLETLPQDVIGMEGLSQEQAGLFFMLGADEFTHGDTCDFESEAFIHILQYLNSLPKSYESWLRITGWSNMSEQEKAQMRIDGSIRLVFENIPQMRSAVGFAAVYGTEDWRLIGFPSANNAGIVINTMNAMVITKYNQKQDQSWDFIKSIVLSVQENLTPESRFPILKERCEHVLSMYDDIRITAYPDSFGWWEDVYDPDIPEDPLVKANGGMIYRFDQEARARMMKFLDMRCEPIKNNDDIIEIILEEVSAMTAGHSSPEECAKKINSRVKILLAERG